MPLNDSYAALGELKKRMGIENTAKDTALTEALATASRSIEKFCGRQFNKETTATARVYYPSSWCLVEIDDFHTASGLIVKTDEGDDGTYETTWASTDFQKEPLNGVVDGITGWPFHKIRAVARSFPTSSRRAPVEITAQWGWNAVPAPIKEACLMVAEETYKLRDAPFGVAGTDDFGLVRVGQGTVNRAERMLKRYRLNEILVA